MHPHMNKSDSWDDFVDYKGIFSPRLLIKLIK